MGTDSLGSLATVVALLAAGVAAGIIGSGGGVTSLVSYPALLAVGVPPLPANVANLVAGVAIGPVAALSSRPELTGNRRTVLRLVPVTVAGAAAGIGLLLATPPGVFARLVPFLVAAGSAVLLLQPVLLRLRRPAGARAGVLGTVLVGVVSVYGGYFGAGSGVMLLAVVSVLVDPRIPSANAIKNVLVGITSIVAALAFAGAAGFVAGLVPWGAVVPLAVGIGIGSALGPVLVRRLPPGLVRWVAAVGGFVLAAYLWLRPS